MRRSALASLGFAWLIKRKFYYCYKNGSEEFEMFIPFSCTMWCDRLIPDIWCCDSHQHISYLTLTYIHLILGLLYLTHDIWQRYLSCYTYHMISNTDTYHAILIIWYLTPILAMLYLTLDIGHRVLVMLYLTPDIITLDTWHAITRTSTLDLILWHLYYITYSWLSLLRGLGMIIILLPDFWYSWTLVLLNSWTPVFLNPCNRETPDIMLLIIYSC